MPTFDFICKDCSKEFEFARPFGSRQKPHCPVCGSTKTEKLIAPPVIHFKGAGFFVTDSKTATEKKAVTPKKEDTTTAPEKKTEAPEQKKSEKKTKSE
jgi:putative FmdB family regulatory protein